MPKDKKSKHNNRHDYSEDAVSSEYTDSDGDSWGGGDEESGRQRRRIIAGDDERPEGNVGEGTKDKGMVIRCGIFNLFIIILGLGMLELKYGFLCNPLSEEKDQLRAQITRIKCPPDEGKALMSKVDGIGRSRTKLNEVQAEVNTARSKYGNVKSGSGWGKTAAVGVGGLLIGGAIAGGITAAVLGGGGGDG